MRLPPRALGCEEIKKFYFCDFHNNPTPPLLFIRPPYKYVQQHMEFYDKFVDRFQDLSKESLLSPRGRSNNYLELPVENVSGNIMVSH